MGRFILYLIPLVLAVYCLVNVITSRNEDIRNLPKVGWIVIILFFPLIGSIVWLFAGRPIEARDRRSPYERRAPQFPEYDRPGRLYAPDPEADAEFLKKVRERAEEQRRKAQEEKRRQQGQQSDEPDGATGAEG